MRNSFGCAMMARVALLGGAALWIAGLVAAGQPAAAQARKSVKIHLLYNAHVERVRPSPIGATLNNDVTVTLSGKNEIHESFDTRAAIFGQSANSRMALGGSGEGRWRVAGPNNLVRINSWPQSQTFLTVTVNGSTCSVNVEYRLRPGFTEYKFWDFQLNTWGYYSQATFLGGTCTIESM